MNQFAPLTHRNNTSTGAFGWGVGGGPGSVATHTLKQALHFALLQCELTFKEFDALSQFDNRFDACEVDSLILRKLLDPTQRRNVTVGVCLLYTSPSPRD